MAMMSILIIGSGAASVVAIGVEDMPKSLKGKRQLIMNFFIDLLNTVIQVSIMTYLPYYFLITNKDIDDKDGKRVQL